MRASFLRDLKDIQADIPAMPVFVVPSSFDPGDEALLAFPIPLTSEWSSCERFLRERKACVAMTRLPLFWQLETLLHDACAATGVPMFIASPQNTPVAAAAITALDIDTVITSGGDVGVFVAHLSSKAIPLPKNWFIVFTPGESWSTPAALRKQGTHVQQEVHFFPGVVLLEQCAVLRGSMTPRFHASEGVHIETRGATSFATLDKEFPLPVTNLEVPFSLRTCGTCACGRESVQQYGKS